MALSFLFLKEILSGHHNAKQYYILADNFWKVLTFEKNPKTQEQTTNLKGKKPGNSSAEKKNYINPLI